MNSTATLILEEGGDLEPYLAGAGSDLEADVARDITAAEPSESAAVSASASRRLEQLDQIPGGVYEQDL
jgi:hypothetical protein